jgi:hypothetical protein
VKRLLAVCLALLVVCAPAALAQEKKKKGQDPTRTVQGVVMSPDDQTAPGAVVYLKNLKTLQIRTFLTREGGTYYFHGLSPEVDYELRAEAKGSASPVKTLSAFDTRPQPTINLKLAKK